MMKTQFSLGIFDFVILYTRLTNSFSDSVNCSVNCLSQTATHCFAMNGDCLNCKSNFKETACTECDDGFWGDDCSTACDSSSQYCLLNKCIKKTGKCAECEHFFKMPSCSDCVDGHWGNNCNKTCLSANCQNNECFKMDGNCIACQNDTRLPPLCQECPDGSYGPDCIIQCMPNCNRCTQQDGLCLQCRTNFQLPLCKECMHGFWSSDCSKTCGDCKKPKECKQETGECIDESSKNTTDSNTGIWRNYHELSVNSVLSAFIVMNLKNIL